eukprot:10333854-Alexandrium_andersonii.AAC.1
MAAVGNLGADGAACYARLRTPSSQSEWSDWGTPAVTSSLGGIGDRCVWHGWPPHPTPSSRAKPD